MIADYQCEMVLVYKKEWIGSIEHGHEEIYQKD